MILLDTNVISELMRPAPEPLVLLWLDCQERDAVCTCTIVVAELLSGIELIPRGRRRTQLQEKADTLISSVFQDKILPFDLPASAAYAAILHNARKAGRPIDEMDALIAAIALASGSMLATRNTSDFSGTGVVLINPWIDE